MSSITSIAFGSGVLIATPASATVATPVQFGTIQDVSVDFSFESKSLMGLYQFPVAIGRGAGKISGKAKFANIDGAVFNTLFFGNAETAGHGQKLWSNNEAGTVSSSSPYTYTVVNAGSFDEDLGVAYALSGLYLTRVAAVTAAGQYSVAAGVYTFYSGDEGKAIFVNYSYTTAAGGANAVISNKTMGSSVTFQIDFYQTAPNVAGAQWSLRLYACMASKLSLASKNSDFTIPELDFEAFANSSNNIGEINTATA